LQPNDGHSAKPSGLDRSCATACEEPAIQRYHCGHQLPLRSVFCNPHGWRSWQSVRLPAIAGRSQGQTGGQEHRHRVLEICSHQFEPLVSNLFFFTCSDLGAEMIGAMIAALGRHTQTKLIKIIIQLAVVDTSA